MNKYALLNYDMDDEDADMSQVEACELEIDSLVAAFVDGLKRVQNKYPEAGIGDTATDEEIASQLYTEIHYNG